jgi:hypothetical protein
LERSTGQRRSGAGEVEQRIPARGRRGKGTVLPRGPELSAAEWRKALRGLTREIGPGTSGPGEEERRAGLGDAWDWAGEWRSRLSAGRG